MPQRRKYCLKTQSSGRMKFLTAILIEAKVHFRFVITTFAADDHVCYAVLVVCILIKSVFYIVSRCICNGHFKIFTSHREVSLMKEI